MWHFMIYVQFYNSNQKSPTICYFFFDKKKFVNLSQFFVAFFLFGTNEQKKRVYSSANIYVFLISHNYNEQ